MREDFFNNVKQLRISLKGNGINFYKNDSHITIIPVQGAIQCRKVADRLLDEHGIYLQPINFPTVPVGEECLRIIITAKHLPKHINHLAYSLKKVLNENNQIDREKFKAVAFTN